eukprot:1992875-Rhodomonas_salina.1
MFEVCELKQLCQSFKQKRNLPSQRRQFPHPSCRIRNNSQKIVSTQDEACFDVASNQLCKFVTRMWIARVAGRAHTLSRRSFPTWGRYALVPSCHSPPDLKLMSVTTINFTLMQGVSLPVENMAQRPFHLTREPTDFNNHVQNMRSTKM